MKHLFLLFLGISASLQDDIKVITDANNLFTPAIYKEISKTENNFLTSPFSLEIILSLALSGAKGTTAGEIQNVLHLPQNQKKIENGVKTLLPKLKSGDYNFHTANKIYLSKNFTLKSDFLKVATGVYASESETINFGQTSEAARTINQWVEQQTEQKIRDLVGAQELSEDTNAILVNALYFNGKWNHFDPENTKKTDFYRNGQNAVKVDMMYNSDSGQNFNYHESTELDAKFLELDFKGSDVSLTVILPNKRNGLAALETKISKVFVPFQPKAELVYVGLPKLKLETKIDFRGVLENLGLRALFDKSAVDLSGIAGKKGELEVSRVIQKCYIDVQEKGVEAAAASFFGASLNTDKPTPKEFIVDHPFIFYIKAQGVIIFAGRITDPKL